ncbi:universal stress protein [Halococcus sp. AFM35]|uniref:universal stress protein n=1 Tax=Halococcus sp. AFM35 TaxID=3421653 RepID=UPI003EB87624
MTEARDLFEVAVLPVASATDAQTTCAGAAAHLRRAGGRAVVVHVIEGSPPTDEDEHTEDAEETFAAAREAFGAADIDIETRLEYGEDIPETVFAVADEVDASAIAFTPRAGGRWVKLLSGDLTSVLVSDSDRPVVVLPDRHE